MIVVVSRLGALEETFQITMDYSVRQPAWMKYGTDLSEGTGFSMHMGNWSSTQAGEMLAIYLCRPVCEHDVWNAWGGTTVGRS